MVRFATTRWSLIMDARGEPEQARRALEAICRNYRRPVLAFIRHRGHGPSEAEDLTQEFFARLLERRWDTQADPARGRFRAFLLTSLKHFLANARAASVAAKRGSGSGGLMGIEPLDTLPGQSGRQASVKPLWERRFARRPSGLALPGRHGIHKRAIEAETIEGFKCGHGGTPALHPSW